MDIQKLVRSAPEVHAALTELEDGRVVAKKPVKIYIPTRFAERGLASIGSEIYIVGIYAITVNDLHYGVSVVNAMMRIEPTSMMKTTIDNDEYYEFFFEPGSTVFPSTQLVKMDTLVYRIYDEIISKGRVPWYLGYTELGRLFDTAKYHAGANIGENPEVTELIISMIARDKKDRRFYYRQVVKSLDDVQKSPPVFIPLRNITYGATNTTNKLAGSYFNEGMVSALVNPADRQERIESLLTK